GGTRGKHGFPRGSGAQRSDGDGRPVMAHGKNYRNAKSLFDREHEYSPVEAVRLLKEMQTAKFDETVEVHFRLGLNVRHADEQLRGTLMLPHGTGKEATVDVFAAGAKFSVALVEGARG